MFYDDYQAISGDVPNWQAYLIERPSLLWLTGHSTHWRATCQYNIDGTVYTDYLRASLEDFDIIRDVPTVVETCRPYDYVNIRENKCVNCTARTWYFKGVWPLHIDSDLTGSCDFDGSDTDAAIASEDNFGLYATINTKFRCTSSSDATTQFWIWGTEWSHDHCFSDNLNWLELLFFCPQIEVYVRHADIIIYLKKFCLHNMQKH